MIIVPIINLTNDQVIELFKQLPPSDKRAVLEALIADKDTWWEETLIKGENQLRRLCAERGYEWNKMSEEEREAFIDMLMHED